MGEGWQLLKISGIPLRIHPSWFVILLLATLGFEQQYGIQLAGQASSASLWLLALGTALLLFVSVLLLLFWRPVIRQGMCMDLCIMLV